MIQHIKGKFVKSPKVVENTAGLRELLDNRYVFRLYNGEYCVMLDLNLKQLFAEFIQKAYKHSSPDK